MYRQVHAHREVHLSPLLSRAQPFATVRNRRRFPNGCLSIKLYLGQAFLCYVYTFYKVKHWLLVIILIKEHADNHLGVKLAFATVCICYYVCTL